MAGWHSLSGYLLYKNGNNALGRFIMKRRAWCVLEESLGQLHMYKSEEDFHKHRSSQGHIDLNGAAINLDLEHQNQFIVLSQNKEHIFTAENHESMMIWLLGLQAKRDLQSRKSTSTQDKTPTANDLDLFGSRPNLFMPPEGERFEGQSHGHPVDNMGSKKMFHWGSYGLHKSGESVDSGMSVYKRRFPEPGENPPSSRSRSLPPVFEGLESSKSFPEQGYQEKKRLQRTKGLSYSHALLYHDASDNDDVFGMDQQVNSPKKTSVQHWKKVQAMVMGRSRHDSYHPVEMANGESADRNSVSSRSVSSDSAIEKGEGTPQELTARLAELERELISTKCELAKVMNRQTCFQEMLIQKEDTIRELEDQNGHSPEIKEDKKKNKSQQKNEKAEKEFQEKIRVLQNQNRFLNEEVKKLAKIRLQEHGKSQEQNLQLSTLEAEIEKWKMDYVCLIQSSIRHPGGEGMDDLELCLYGGDKHKKRVQALLDEARKINPRLPTYESLANNEVHVDEYGFKHMYTNTGLLLHYLCTELTHHYLVQAGVYEEHMKTWTIFMRQHGKAPMKCLHELKTLCRGGVPDRYRRQVWRQLVHHKVRDIMQAKGDYYYRNLCNLLPESPLAACYRKQISLDLMRTMPNNIKFSTQGSKGIMDLQDVLLAFCVHNPSIGYCQGMNFIVAMALIFLEAEDAFWTLVAIAERYFSPHYFDHSLIGAQADQQILKDVVKEKLPALSEHLESIDIELSTITLNWFLAVFFDAVPFQAFLKDVFKANSKDPDGSPIGALPSGSVLFASTAKIMISGIRTLLRIWDCFLLEGPKVLFRFSLSILKLHEKDILQKTDTMGIMKHLKACAKLSYDVEGIVQLAFYGMKPFPKRRDIQSKETCYLNLLKEKHKKRELQRLAFAEREQLYMNMEAEAGTFMGIECAVAISEGHVWFCYGDQHIGKLCYVSCDNSSMHSGDYTLDSRLMCMCTMGQDKLVLGTISWMLVAVSIANQGQDWQIQLHDAILSVCCYDDDEVMAVRIFAGLADGTVAVTEKPNGKLEPNVDVMYIPIGQAPVTCLMLLGEQVWSASGNTVAVIHAKTLDTMDTFSVSVNPYDHILSLVPSEFGIWISLRGSSILELWDPKTLNCRMLYDTRTDRYPHLRKEDDTYFNRARITSTLVNGNRVWVGTGEGNLIIYEIVESAQLKTPTEHSPSVETSSTISYMMRPDRKKGLCGNDITITLQSLCDLKRDSGNISGDSLEVHPEEEGEDSYPQSMDQNLRVLNRRRQGTISKNDLLSEKRGMLRRRSSSENDMGILQANRYLQDGTCSDDQQSKVSQDETHLSVKGLMPKKNCSENDLQKLGEERMSFDKDFKDENDDKLEQELEAQARRESLSMYIESDSEEEPRNRQRRHSHDQGSITGKENIPKRKTSLEMTGRRKMSWTMIQKSKDSYKSDDSGCETRSRPSRRKCSTTSRKTSLPKKESSLQSNADTEEDVYEVQLEQRARRESLVVLDVDNGSVLLNVPKEENAQDMAKHKRVKHLLGIHQGSSMYSDSSVSIDLEDGAKDVDRGMELVGCSEGININYMPIIPLDENYLSSSPGMSLTPSPLLKTTMLGLSIDSVEEEELRKALNENAIFGSSNIDTTEAKPERNRRQSVIEDMSVMCSDCRALKAKCAECRSLLTGQELLKINEKKMSLVEPVQLIDGKVVEMKQELEKKNGLVAVSDADESQGYTFLTYAADNDHSRYNGEEGMTNVYGLNSAPVQKDVANKDEYMSQPVQRKKEIFSKYPHTFDGTVSFVTDESGTNGLLQDTDNKNERCITIFPGERERKDLSRREKVGYWLSSIASTQEYSIDKDDIIAEGQKALAEQKADSNRASAKSDIEEVFMDTDGDGTEGTVGADRPKTLNLTDRVSRYYGSRANRLKLMSTESVGSDASSGTTRKSIVSEVTLNQKDPGTQYRLDFTNVRVDTDAESEAASTPVNHIENTANAMKVDSRKNSLDLGTIKEKASKLDSDIDKVEKTKKDNSPGQSAERQKIFEFLKTPSLATRHSSLGLKIIEDDIEWTEQLYGRPYSSPSPTSSTDQRFADFLRTPSISSKRSSLWSSYENISTPSNEPQESKLLLPAISSRGQLSHSASSTSIGSDNDLIYNVDLSLEAKVKISDKPVKCLLATSCKNEPIILSFAGSHGDDEAVLKWRKHQNEDLWTNEPILEICPKTKQTILPSYMRRRISSNSSYGSVDSSASNNNSKS